MGKMKDQLPSAHFDSARRRRMSRHRTATARVKICFSRANSDGDVLEQHERAPIAAVQVVTAPRQGQSMHAQGMIHAAQQDRGALLQIRDLHGQQ